MLNEKEEDIQNAKKIGLYLICCNLADEMGLLPLYDEMIEEILRYLSPLINTTTEVESLILEMCAIDEAKEIFTLNNVQILWLNIQKRLKNDTWIIEEATEETKKAIKLLKKTIK